MKPDRRREAVGIRYVTLHEVWFPFRCDSCVLQNSKKPPSLPLISSSGPPLHHIYTLSLIRKLQHVKQMRRGQTSVCPWTQLLPFSSFFSSLETSRDSIQTAATNKRWCHWDDSQVKSHINPPINNSLVQMSKSIITSLDQLGSSFYLDGWWKGGPCSLLSWKEPIATDCADDWRFIQPMKFWWGYVPTVGNLQPNQWILHKIWNDKYSKTSQYKDI